MNTHKYLCACGAPLSGYRAKQCVACYKAGRARTRQPGGQLLSTQERTEYGCLLTFENATGEQLTVHQTGAPGNGLKLACAHALSLDPSYRLRAYSTPDTILADLDGARADIIGGKGHNQRRPLPEALALGQVGLAHMIHPALAEGLRQRW